MSRYSFVTTSNSLVVISPDGTRTVVQETAPNYKPLYNALQNLRLDPDNEVIQKLVKDNLTVSSAIESWAKGHFKIDGNTVTYKGEKVPDAITQRMLAMAAKGEDPTSLMNFWEKLQQNPSWRSVEQLYPFIMKHEGIPILPNGNFLAYKGVNSNYTDAHSGRVDNKPGTINEMARNKISDDPNTPCHYGFHVGDMSYARSFAEVMIVCEVDPRDVVCIPYDESRRKMRVCKYRVVGNHNGELLPSTSYVLEEDLGKGVEIQHEEEELEDKNAVTKTEIEILKKDGLIAAIKAYRTRTGLGLKEAKDAIDAVRVSLKPTEVPVTTSATPAVGADKNRFASVGPEVTEPIQKEKHIPVERKLKNKRAADKHVELKVPKAFRQIHQMTMRQLMDVDLQKLRTYASQVLSIVGASKIPGGKAVLANRIISVRKHFR